MNRDERLKGIKFWAEGGYLSQIQRPGFLHIQSSEVLFLLSELDAAEAKLEETKELYKRKSDQVMRFSKKNDSLEAKLKEAREVVEFYAYSDYDDFGCGCCGDHSDEQGISTVRGFKAKALLERWKD